MRKGVADVVPLRFAERPMPLPISPVGSGFRIVDSSGKLGGTADDAAVIIALSRFASDAVVVAVKMWCVSGVTSV